MVGAMVMEVVPRQSTWMANFYFQFASVGIYTNQEKINFSS